MKKHPELADSRDGLLAACQAIIDCFDKGGILYLCGNGGSFADASHIKGELAKSFARKRTVTDEALLKKLQSSDTGKRLAETLEVGFPVVVLGESHSLRSAFENDRDPVLHYAQELHAFAAHIKRGVFLGLSTSGDAQNVYAAMTLAAALDLTTISFTGPAGGKLAEIADIDWRTPAGTNPSEIQEEQLPLYHALCLMIEANYFK
jgi:D-sedoheptulose 7-phosphate isomerase